MTVEITWDGKYDADGEKRSPLRIALPFQTVETINESVQERQRSLEKMFSREDGQGEWRNRLIWGDKKYVLPSLLEEFAGKVNLIYIDPPFDTGANFSYSATIPDDPDTEGDQEVTFVKEPSMIEQKAYRDTWGRDLDSYLKWFHETVSVLRELLAENGSIYVHLDWHVGHYAKSVLDEVFGIKQFRNEIVWWYYNKMQGNVSHFPRNHDTIFYYVKGAEFKFERLREPREKTIRQQKQAWDSES